MMNVSDDVYHDRLKMVSGVMNEGIVALYWRPDVNLRPKGQANI